MKKLSKIKLNESIILNDSEMRMVLGGEQTITGCGTAKDVCQGKNSGDSCKSGPTCSRGTCKYVPFSGLVCWRM